MGKTMYQKCEELLRNLQERVGRRVGLVTLKNEVRKKIGGNEKRTVQPNLRFMLDTALIKDVGQAHFEITLDEEEALTEEELKKEQEHSIAKLEGGDY